MNIKSQLKAMLMCLMLVVGAQAFAADQPIYTDHQSTITVTPHHPVFTIKLRSNPTTGYRWSLREYDHRFLQPLTHRFEAPNTKLIGAPGYELWTFRVMPAAFQMRKQMNIQFMYARHWERAGHTMQTVFRVSTAP